MSRTISLVLVIPAVRVAHSVRGFDVVVTIDVDGLGRGHRGRRHQTCEHEIERRNHLKLLRLRMILAVYDNS